MSNTNELNTNGQNEPLNQNTENMHTASSPDNFNHESSYQEYTENEKDYPENSYADEPLSFGLSNADVSEQSDTSEHDIDNLSEEQMTSPEDTETAVSQSAAETAAAPGIAEKCFNIFSKLGLPILILFTLILCGQQFVFPRDFWFSEEVRYADIYMNMLSSHNFFTLTLNGHPYAETGPLYFIFVWLLDAIPTINMPQAFFGASILFAVFFIASTWILARGLGYSSKIAFTAGLLALSMFFLASFTNYTRMDLLFAGFLNLSYLCFFRAWQKKSAPIWLFFAFLFLCFASLTSTFIAFIFPFIASLLYFLWTAKYKRINSADGILGFLFSLLIIFAWFAYIYLQGNAEYITLLLDQQLIQNIKSVTTLIHEPYWYYLAGLPFALFPWIFIILFASWGSWLKNSPKAFKERKENNASVWLILLIITHLGIFSLFKDKSFSNLVTVIPFFAILFAKSLLSFSPLRSKIFFGFLALLTSLSGIFFLILEFHGYILEYLPQLWIVPKEIPAFIEVLTTNTYFGISTMGGILILLGILLWYGVKRHCAGGSLLIYTIGIILMLQPLNLLVAPQLGTVFSTKNHAYEMAAIHKKEGAVPASYHIYPDVFTYYYNEALDKTNYSKATIAQFDSIEPLTEFLLNNDKVILAISEKDFQELPYKNEATVLAYKQWIEHQYIILTYWNISSHKPSIETNTQEIPTDEEIINNSTELLTNEEEAAIVPQPIPQPADHAVNSVIFHDNAENSDSNSALMPDEQQINPEKSAPHAVNNEQNEQAEIGQENQVDDETPLTQEHADSAEQNNTEANGQINEEANGQTGEQLSNQSEKPAQEQETEANTAQSAEEVTL